MELRGVSDQLSEEWKMVNSEQSWNGVIIERLGAWRGNCCRSTLFTYSDPHQENIYRKTNVLDFKVKSKLSTLWEDSKSNQKLIIKSDQYHLYTFLYRGEKKRTFVTKMFTGA